MKTNAPLIILGLGLALLAPTLSRADGPPKLFTTVEGISEYRLDNGLRVLLFPDQSKAQVTVNVTYIVGSRHEGYGETGMAHLLEHMLFKGTPTHNNVFGLLQDHGAEFNGSTSYDRTNYFESLPASTDSLKWALEMESDRMVNSKIDNADLQKEFSVVRNEFEMGENSPGNILEERMMSAAYLWHNYGKSTIGSRSDIERVPIESLRSFYKRFYQPDNAMLVVAGKFDPATALSLIGKTFGALPRPTRKLAPTYTIEPVQDGERSVQLRRTGDVPVVGLMYHGLAGSSADFVAEEALAHILGNKPSGRIYKALVDKGLAARVRAQADPLADPGVLEIIATGRPGKSVSDLRAALVESVQSVAKSTITDEEVKRWKSETLRSIELGMIDSQRLGIELSEWAAMGDWRLVFVHRDQVEKVTAADVQRFAANYLKPSNSTIGEFIPEAAPLRAPLPDSVDVAKLVVDYKGRTAAQEGEQFVATLENIEKRTTRSTLPNGLKLALLPKKTRGGAVKIVITIRAGSEKDLHGKVAVVDLLPRMLIRGSKKHSYQQLKSEFDRLKAEVSFSSDFLGQDPTASEIYVSTERDNVPAVIALIGEVVREPAFSKAEFETLRKEVLSRQEEFKSDPQIRALITLLQKRAPWPATDPRHIPSIEEHIAALKAVSADDLAQFHRAFWGGSYADVAIVGEFDADATTKAVTAALGDWKSPHPFVRLERPFQKGIAASDETIRTPDKAMAFVGVSEGFELRDDEEDYPAVRLLNFIMGGGARSRMMNRLRQKEGLSYGAFSSMSADAFEREGGLLIGAICAPQNAVKAMAALREEVQRLRTEPVPAGELGDAKKGYALSFANQLASDDDVASMLDRSLYLGRTLDFQQKQEDKMQQATAQDLLRVAQKYIAPERFASVIAGDLK